MTEFARLVPDEFGENMANAADFTPRELTRTVRRIVARADANITERTPVGWSGTLRGGYSHEVRRPNTSRPVGIVANPTPYHDIRDEGRRPGRQPPVAPLIPWVGSKLGAPVAERRQVAFLVARKIGRRGYAGAQMVRKGWGRTRREVRPELRKMGLRIIRVADGGRG